MYSIVAFDQSLTHSAAVQLDSYDHKSLKLVRQEVFKPKTTGIYRLMQIKEWMANVIIGGDRIPDVIVRELHNHRTWGAGNAIHAVNGILDLIVHHSHFLTGQKYMMIPSGVWKKFCLGRGNFKKDTAYMVHMNKFFMKTRWLSGSNSFEILDDNIGDAICLGITGFAAKGYGDLTEDEKKLLDKNRKVMFDYGSNESTDSSESS